MTIGHENTLMYNIPCPQLKKYKIDYNKVHNIQLF